MTVDISQYKNELGLRNKIGRVLWGCVWALLFRPSPRIFFGWRRMLLRMFGARIGKGVNVYPSCRVWAPWNLTMKDYSSLSHFVDCYSVDRVVIGAHTTVSQYSYLCTASHDFTISTMPLTTAPIRLGDSAWIAADAFVGPGVTVGEGAVVGARSSVFKNVEPWSVVGGNPARFIRKRVMQRSA